MELNWLDWTFIGLTAASVLIGFVRGFLREVFSLVSWVAAIWLAFVFSPTLAPYFDAHIQSQSLRLLLSFAVIFVAVVVLGAILSHVISELAHRSGLSGTDRTLGLVFGGIRGVLLVVLLVFLAKFTPFTEEDWWKTSILVPHMEKVLAWVTSVLPPLPGAN